MAITSRMLSTTQITSCFLMELEQMEQISPSATLKQRWQNFISLRIRAITSLNCPTSLVSCFNKCNTKRKAVFLPMPGSLANSLTAFSKREEENCILRRYKKNKAQGTSFGDPLCLHKATSNSFTRVRLFPGFLHIYIDRTKINSIMKILVELIKLPDHFVTLFAEIFCPYIKNI